MRIARSRPLSSKLPSDARAQVPTIAAAPVRSSGTGARRLHRAESRREAEITARRVKNNGPLCQQSEQVSWIATSCGVAGTDMFFHRRKAGIRLDGGVDVMSMFSSTWTVFGKDAVSKAQAHELYDFAVRVVEHRIAKHDWLRHHFGPG